MPEARPPCLVLAGPTASGKTEASLALARHWPIEIISMDSALVYRGMDVGTAKPSAEEQAAVPHHLIDLIEPTQAYSAADFARDARGLIQDIQARGRTALVVGGSGLYVRALLDGLKMRQAREPGLDLEWLREALQEALPKLIGD